MFTAVWLKAAVPGQTTEALYKVLAWSLNCLALGMYPTADHNGKLFEEGDGDMYTLRGQPLHQRGLRGVWSELRGDWKWQVETFHLDQYYQKSYICHLCRAHTTIKRLWFTQFGRAAKTRKTLVKSHVFRDWYTDRFERPAIFDVIGFDIWRCWVDAMHCLDLGVYESVAASCLVELIQQGVWGHHDDEDLFKLAHEDYKGWCRGKSLPPAPRFEKGRLWKSVMEFPRFTQQSAKASATR